jgi:hypothetical protein
MKLLFNKKELYGHWFNEENETINSDWTEKIPPNTGYIFNDNLNEWVSTEINEDNSLENKS